MRNTHSANKRAIPTALFVAAAGLLVGSPASADPLHRLSADFQNTETGVNAASTNLPALANGAGGLLTYSKAVIAPLGVRTLYVTFSAQGIAHNGSALLMRATVNHNKCQPLLGQTGGGGGGPHSQTGWYTLVHLPAAGPGVTNCNDGGGGTGDCHDNTIYFSCCTRASAGTQVVKIYLADLPGLPGGAANSAYYERSTVYIDVENGQHCTPHGLP